MLDDRRLPDPPDEPEVTSAAQLEDYMRDLQRRAANAEREARQLRNALAMSDTGSMPPEDSDTESLFLPQGRRGRPKARLRQSVDEEPIEPVQARRMEQLPLGFGRGPHRYINVSADKIMREKTSYTNFTNIDTVKKRVIHVEAKQGCPI